MSDENTIRIVHTIRKDLWAGPEDIVDETVRLAEKTAEEAGKELDPGTLHYIGEVDPPRPPGFENYDYPEYIGFYGFEAEAV